MHVDMVVDVVMCGYVLDVIQEGVCVYVDTARIQDVSSDHVPR